MLSTRLRARKPTSFFAVALALCASAIVGASAIAAGGSATPATSPEHGIAAVPVASGLTQPIYLTAPAGDPRLFVVEQGGLIRIIEDGVILPTPFLDLSGLTESSGERGLLGLAFAPDYATTGFLYVNYTASTAAGETHPDPDVGPGDTVIDRFQAGGDPDADVIDPTTRHRILTIAQPRSNHNGGTLAFGPDGMLWIGMGDGGGGGDPDENAQDPSTLLGKMLRIDVSGSTTAQPFSIPSDNPFVEDGSVRDEIWALGFRNPYRWSFDRQTDDLYVADVGQASWEEIDVEPGDHPGGRNYGWDCKEGTHDFEFTSDCTTETLTPPVHEYPHFSSGCTSVTGGYVYRGDAIPDLRGHYFFADFCQGKVWSFVWDGAGGTVDFRDRTAELTPPGFGSIDFVAGFGEDGSGELYVVDRDGEVFKIVPAGLHFFIGDS